MKPEEGTGRVPISPDKPAERLGCRDLLLVRVAIDVSSCSSWTLNILPSIDYRNFSRSDTICQSYVMIFIVIFTLVLRFLCAET